MSFISTLSTAGAGNPEKLAPVFLWTLAEYAFRGVPYGILLAAVLEFYKPLAEPSLTLDTRQLGIIWIALAAAVAVQYFISRKAYFSVNLGSYGIGAEGRITIAEKLRRLPMGFFNSRDQGSIGAYLISDYANVEHMISHLLTQIAGAVIMPVVLLVFLAFQNWQLALAGAAVIPLALPAYMIAKRIVISVGVKHHKAKTAASSRMLEYLAGIRFIKSFGLTGVRFERLEKAFRELKRLSIKIEASAGPTAVVSTIILNAGLTVIIVAGLAFLLTGRIDIPVYITFLILGSRAFEPLIQAFIYVNETHYYNLSVKRVTKLLDEPVQTGGGAPKPERFDIEFRNVSFSYNETYVLENISLKLPEQSFTAVVGTSGSGKTTLTRLIARFWDTCAGEVLLGGCDVREYKPEDLLSCVSMVFQDVYLFDDTVYNNIAIGNRTASESEVKEAAEKAGCAEFIERLPDKYGSFVGEGGSRLSGGEKQRLSIARAILKNAPVILLDEATASLDPENEKHIQAAVNELVKNKTVLVIAHRLNTVVNADKIVVMDRGRIAEEGAHSELLESGGLYRRLWDEQQRIKDWMF
ncbi:ABC transporter ATP-binding protein [Geovibrio thiophilus]|uniref:ABC transporter ATP-binding protein n=1 Tax=Geovibrio thiophilus TaxID=139438 RepID=A0A410JZA1_9BACT|nr:ABC transporter ATP-binding protein [Geovibrio thiophilus]QAR33510.1 ABC transporter ATP-binding protein [Geovibrio thiophilus]